MCKLNKGPNESSGKPDSGTGKAQKQPRERERERPACSAHAPQTTTTKTRDHITLDHSDGWKTTQCLYLSVCFQCVCAARRAAQTSWNFLFFFCFLAASGETALRDIWHVRPNLAPLAVTLTIKLQQTARGTALKIMHIYLSTMFSKPSTKVAANSQGKKQTGKRERSFSRSGLTVVAFLQDVWRRYVHNLFYNKREGLLRSRRSGGAAGLKRHCHRGFARHCSPSSSEHTER